MINAARQSAKDGLLHVGLCKATCQVRIPVFGGRCEGRRDGRIHVGLCTIGGRHGGRRDGRIHVGLCKATCA